MTVLLVYPPFCTPAGPSYSIAYLMGFIKNNSDIDIKVFDANVFVHDKLFSEEKDYFSNLDSNYNKEEYERVSVNFLEGTKKLAMDNAHKVLNDEKPVLFEEAIKKITDFKPEIVGFSVVYASQVFYTTILIKELKNLGIKTVIGGPAISPQLARTADVVLKNEVEFLEFLSDKPVEHDKLKIDVSPDYSQFDLKDYFVSEGVIPIRTTTSCYYQKCTFCSHHNNIPYHEYSLPAIMKSLKETDVKNVFFVDDMIHKKRLLEIAGLIKPLGKRWMCQLKPSFDLDEETLKILYDSGLRIVIWGVESGSQRILDLMRKQTTPKMIETTLERSRKAGIINATYIMFGFPTETEEEFMQTVELIEKNADNIDLISSSIFGLQENTPIFKSPKDFGIINVTMSKRTLLGPKISYDIKEGLTHDKVRKLKKRVAHRLNKINKFPSKMNYFREHMMDVLAD